MTVREIRGRLGMAGISQGTLAVELGVSQGALSQWLRGLSALPEGMEERVDAALTRLEAAERAADEARARVLAEGRELPEFPVYTDANGNEHAEF